VRFHEYLAIFALFGVIIFLVVRWLFVWHGSYKNLADVGTMKGLSITTVKDPSGVHRVGITFVKAEVCLTVAQAHQLAEWLRLAALPGRTLAVARFNQRHGSH